LHVAAVYNGNLAVNIYLHQQYMTALHTPTAPHGRYPLHESVWFCHNPDVVTYYLQQYQQAISTPTSEGHLPLHFLLDAVYMNPARITCLYLLLKAFPLAVNAIDNEGETPLTITRRHNHGDLIVRLLLRACPLKVQYTVHHALHLLRT
jgi:ankyrin repeat protein